MAHTRILLVDDHAVVRGGLRMLLAADAELEIVGEARDGAEALQAARRAAATHRTARALAAPPGRRALLRPRLYHWAVWHLTTLVTAQRTCRPWSSSRSA